mmetsp:Transcript_22312/g.46395  ORF Transcript_22312/g.46395 Transcript_22312/m.46395 type:complete len:83 (-) Transcript_22312:1835-2083(-)
MTMILSASWTVLNLCAMTTFVTPSPLAAVTFSMISPSVPLSRLLVGSSKSKILPPLRTARAMLTRCFSPPLSLTPLSPTSVS